MENNEHIVRYTAEQIDDMLRRGEDRTNYERLDAMTEDELEASIDPDDEGEIDWSTIQVGFPGPKERLTVRFDVNVVEWFKRQGPGYQTRMNEVLKSYVEAQEHKGTRPTRRAG